MYIEKLDSKWKKRDITKYKIFHKLLNNKIWLRLKYTPKEVKSSWLKYDLTKTLEEVCQNIAKLII